MRWGSCLLPFLLASSAAAQGQVAPVTSATPRVVRAMWLDFPQPTCAPRIRVAVETAVPQGPVRPAANAVATERIHPERVLPLSNVWASLRGGRVRSCGSRAGFATSALWTKPIQAVLELEPMAGSPLGTFEVDFRATIAGAEPRESVTCRIGPDGADWDHGGRAAVHFVGEHQLFAFVAVVPATVAARLPLGELDSWRAHALEALRRSNSPFFRVGEQMGWNLDDRRWLGAAIAFFALVPARSEAARAALWAARSSDEPEQSPVKTALALADDPRGACKAYNRGARGPGQLAFLKQIILNTRHDHLREQAERELRRELGDAVIRNDALLRERLGLPGFASVPSPLPVVYLIAVAVAVGLILRGGRGDRRDPIHGARRRLVLGGFLLWADPIVRGIDLLPDALGYLALFVAGQRLRSSVVSGGLPPQSPPAYLAPLGPLQRRIQRRPGTQPGPTPPCASGRSWRCS